MSSPHKTIFITGAAAGIGRATARLFHARDWAVGLYDLDLAACGALAAELGSRSIAGELDVTDAIAFDDAVASFHDQFGRFDVLLNNAGVLQMGRFDQVPLQMHQRTIAVNVGGVINGIVAALPYLRSTVAAHGRAHIISMCSGSALYGTPEHSTYSASKFAVRGLTEALDLELEGEGIVVCDILPAYVDTALVTQQQKPSKLVEALGIDHTPADVGELIWAAASADKLHWFGTRSLRLADRLARLLPGATRRSLRRQLK